MATVYVTERETWGSALEVSLAHLQACEIRTSAL